MNGRKWLKKRGFAVALSLILCAGTVVSSFAAVEFNKDVHVDENGNLKQADEYYLAGDVELDQTLSINSKEVSIELNGYTLGLADGAVGSVISVTDGKLAVTDAGVEGVERGAGTGAITGGNASDSDFGGGVNLLRSEFSMTGGEISGNRAGNGGGIGSSDSVVILNNCTIRDNTAKHLGGGIWNYHSGSSFTMTGGTLSNNAAGEMGDDVCSYGDARLTLEDVNYEGLLEEDDRGISGWYWDGSERWGSGYVQCPSVKGSADYYLKAAHDEYFAVSDGESVLAEVERGTEIWVGDIEEPARDGWTFVGWTVDGVAVEECLTVTGFVVLEAQWSHDAHNPGASVRENEVPADYDMAGSYEEVVKCADCGEELSREAKEIPALVRPDEPNPPTTPDVPGITEGPGVTEVEEEDVPLAGLPVELAAEEPLTWGRLFAILHWMDGEQAAELSNFMDMAAGHGFVPDRAVTRGQFIEFLNRYAKYVGSDLVLEVEGDANETLTWAMAEEIIDDFFARLYG